MFVEFVLSDIRAKAFPRARHRKRNISFFLLIYDVFMRRIIARFTLFEHARRYVITQVTFFSKRMSFRAFHKTHSSLSFCFIVFVSLMSTSFPKISLFSPYHLSDTFFVRSSNNNDWYLIARSAERGTSNEVTSREERSYS